MEQNEDSRSLPEIVIHCFNQSNSGSVAIGKFTHLPRLLSKQKTANHHQCKPTISCNGQTFGFLI